MNRLKIKYHTPKYVIKEEAKVVICTLEWSILNWDESLKDVICNVLGFKYIDIYEYNKVKVAIRCKGNDVFDVQKGKKIALAKAENKVEAKVLNIISKVAATLADMASVMDTRVAESAKNIKHNIEYIKHF